MVLSLDPPWKIVVGIGWKKKNSIFSHITMIQHTFSKQYKKKSFLNYSFDHLLPVSTAPHLLSITN
jgi:hypothetical protein